MAVWFPGGLSVGRHCPLETSIDVRAEGTQGLHMYLYAHQNCFLLVSQW